jgi:hypothetical protein
MRHVACWAELVLVIGRGKICSICEAVFRIQNIKMSAALNFYLAFSLLIVTPKLELAV